MNRKTLTQIILTLFMVLSISFSAWAEIKAGDILSYSVDGNEITAFVANPEGKKAYELDCQVGTRRPESIESHLITEDPVPVKTLILMDNSLSVRNEHRGKITELLQNMVENHAENEQYTVACFSDRIEYLLKDSSDYDAVKETIANVSYKDQETYLTDVLYDLLSEEKKDGSPVFRRIVIASDGVDNKSIGYTKDELNEVLKKNPIPIYTIGCSANNNDEQLKAMFALSRNSKGEGFLLDDLKDITEFLRSVKQTDYTIRATVVPAEEDRDGTEKGIRITLSTDGGTVQSSFSAEMPFAELAAAESETETAETPADSPTEVKPSETTVPETTAAEVKNETVSESSAGTSVQAEDAAGGRKRLLPVIIAAAALVIAVIVIAVAVRRKKKKGTGDVGQNFGDDAPTELISDDDTPTELISDDDEATMMVEPTVVLVNEKNPEEVYSAELSGTVIVGRKQDCSIVIPEKTVSRQQFEIGRDGYTVWIKNLSEHGTVLNGERVAGMQEIRTGDKITAGGITLLVEIR